MNEQDMELRVRKLEQALFGDGYGNIGMEKKIDRMYEVFTGASFSWMLFIKIIGFLGGAAISIAAIIEIIKFWKR